MFTEFLSLIAGGTAIVAGFMEGRRRGVLGILIGLLIALPAGFAVFWTTRKTIKWVATRNGLYEAQLPPTRLALAWGLILGAIAWTLIAAFTVLWLTRSVEAYL